MRFLSRAARLLVAGPGARRAGRGGADYFRSGALRRDARRVLATHAPITREIRTETGSWHVWHLQPFRGAGHRVSGVLINIIDVTAHHSAAELSEAARRQAERISLGKTRYLAAASHDLRQPLHTLSLLQRVMTRNLCDPTALRQLIRQGEETLVAMSGMLDTLLDINQLEAGVLRPAIMAFPLDRMLERMRNEFGYHTRSHGLGWRTVSCGLEVRSDPRLLEQIVRNLLSNAVKYTRTGRVLLGCRRRGDRLRIEVWDTGPGIPPAQCGAVFEEFYQADNPAHDLRRGAGLGLAIVEHLAGLLGHRIEIRSWEGRGSMFAVEVPRAPAGPPSGD